MNLSEIWIRRPIMTILFMAGILFFGIISYKKLPINNLPNVDFPTIEVSAALPGANSETMASTVAMPLEKQFSGISGVDSMVSSSVQGKTTINLQFSLDRNIDDAAQDVNAAISAAMGVLPGNMPNPPTYKKVNPGDMPIIFLGLVSDTLPITALNDYAENILTPHLSTINGVAQVRVVGTQRFAVRVQVNPRTLANKGIGINEVQDALAAGNVNLPGGELQGTNTGFMLKPYGQIFNAEGYNNLIVTYQNGYPVRIKDIGKAIDGVEYKKQRAWFFSNGQAKRGIFLLVSRQPGTNTVALAKEIKSLMPMLKASMPGSMNMAIFYDQSLFIKESINDVQFTLILTIFLVVIVIFLFIRAVRPTLIPALSVPLSLIGTFAVMDLMGYTLNNLSLMSLTLAVGFVVDDAIVVLENIVRRMEMGENAMDASLNGSKEIGFTILSMTLSLVVVFIPIMFMGGIIGRLFREFPVCITSAILFSGLVSLTLTPVMGSRFMGAVSHTHGRLYEYSEAFFKRMLNFYSDTLKWVIYHRRYVLVFLLFIVVGTVFLARAVPKGFIPTQDQNFFRVFSIASDSISFDSMVKHQEEVIKRFLEDPDIKEASGASAAGFPGDTSGILFCGLKDKAERKSSVDQIINRLRPKLNQIPGLIVSLVNPPLITIGARIASAQWQYTLQTTDIDELFKYGTQMEESLSKLPALTDVRSDLQMRKPTVEIIIDRDKASALGLTLKQIQDAFYSAYSDRQVSTMYTAANQYYVILELAPGFTESPELLSMLYIKSSNGKLIPLSTVAQTRQTVSPLSVNHIGQVTAATISFNLKPGYSIGTAMEDINKLAQNTLPTTITTSFQGSAQAFKQSFASMGFLLIVTVVIIYLVLGMLYESFFHPLTILTALPLAGFGALFALWIFGRELDMYAYVGMIMLIGIVKKNGIMMVDFALDAERHEGLSAEDSIFKACQIRFRPIMMTTMAALFGTLPIALGIGAGGEARQPLGICVVGGLFFSQFMTLYITPVFYIYIDKFNRWITKDSKEKRAGGARIETF
ncbi:MAG: efflux RND transporter permease subunit [Nitrospirae bacterium]|nr:efflux RND transporter permease subunit [Nitrospirota bacterium]